MEGPPFRKNKNKKNFNLPCNDCYGYDLDDDYEYR